MSVIPKIPSKILDPRPAAELPDSTKILVTGLPSPQIIIASSLVILTTVAIGATLYFAKSFFLPLTSALIVGTMLARSAAFLERRRVPRTVAAVAVVIAAWGVVAVIVSLITAPLIQWTGRLPELVDLLKAKMRLFDTWISWTYPSRGLFVSETGGGHLQLPKIEWMQPTLEFLSPTLTEILVFFVTLVLFLASWPDLRRTLVMNFGNRDERLRALKTINTIEQSLGSYLLTVTIINLGVGVTTGLIAAATGNPNPAGLGALAATLNFIPIIGPIAMFVVLVAVGIINFDTLGGAMLAPAAFAAMTFLEGHFLTPAIIGRRLELNAFAVFLALAFWTWLWGPMGAFLASPLLIVCLTLKQHLFPSETATMPF